MKGKNKSKRRPLAHMIHGFVGAGKTTFAKKLEKETGALRFTNDEWMIALYGNNPPAEKFKEYYERTNKLLLNVAFKCLKAGVDIILDDGFWSRSRRDKTRERIKKAGADFRLYHVKCSNEVMKKRTLERSEAESENSFYINEEAIKTFKKRFEPLEKDEKHILINIHK